MTSTQEHVVVWFSVCTPGATDLQVALSLALLDILNFVSLVQRAQQQAVSAAGDSANCGGFV